MVARTHTGVPLCRRSGRRDCALGLAIPELKHSIGPILEAQIVTVRTVPVYSRLTILYLDAREGKSDREPWPSKDNEHNDSGLLCGSTSYRDIRSPNSCLHCQIKYNGVFSSPLRHGTELSAWIVRGSL